MFTLLLSSSRKRETGRSRNSGPILLWARVKVFEGSAIYPQEDSRRACCFI